MKKRKFFHMPLFFCFYGAAGIGLALLQLHLAETDQYHVTRGGRAADSLACKPYEVYRAEKLGRDSGENPEAV